MTYSIMPVFSNNANVSLGPFSTAQQLSSALNRNELSAEELLMATVERIEAVNPAVNAIVAMDVDAARKAARESDERRAANAVRGRLDGITMTVKDSIAVEGFPATSGFPPLANFRPNSDAPSVSRLRRAGVTIVGKSNLSTMASDFQCDNPLFGTTRNPWNLEMTSGGSSGGAAAALAAGMIPLEFGSDIGGSVRQPAHFCGIYAHKPTFELYPQLGHVPPPPGVMSIADMGVLGPMARCAQDLNLALEALLLDEESTCRGRWIPEVPPPRFERLSAARIAVWSSDDAFPVDRATADMMETVAARLEKAGAAVDRHARPFSHLTEVADAYFQLLMPLLLGSYTPNELEAMLERSPNAKFVKLIHAGTRQTSASMAKSKEVQAKAISSWRSFFERFDALICPVAPHAAFQHNLSLPSVERELVVEERRYPYWDHVVWCGALANFAYLPATARPITCTSAGLPMGIQIVGPYLEDRTPIHAALLMDDLFGGFVPPPQFEENKHGN
jgi:amidase